MNDEVTKDPGQHLRSPRDESPVLTFEALEAALTRCMAAHPPTGSEMSLHPDANRMADLFGLMVWERSSSVEWDHIDPRVVDAYGRWRDLAS